MGEWRGGGGIIVVDSMVSDYISGSNIVMNIIAVQSCSIYKGAYGI